MDLSTIVSQDAKVPLSQIVWLTVCGVMFERVARRELQRACRAVDGLQPLAVRYVTNGFVTSEYRTE